MEIPMDWTDRLSQQCPGHGLDFYPKCNVGTRSDLHFDEIAVAALRESSMGSPQGRGLPLGGYQAGAATPKYHTPGGLNTTNVLPKSMKSVSQGYSSQSL